MITLAFSVLVYYFFSQVTQLSGFGGVNNVDLPALVGEPGQDPTPLYYTTLVVAVLVFVGLRYVSRTPFGLALQGLRDEPARMRALGFNVTLHRILAFGLAAFVAAIAGVLSVWYNSRITPGSINLAQTIDVLIIAVIGGLYRLEGAWVGALTYALLDNYSREWTPTVGDVLGPERFNTILGLVFLVIVLLSPGGLVGLWERARERLRHAATGTAGRGRGRTARRCGGRRGQLKGHDRREGTQEEEEQVRGRRMLALIGAMLALGLVTACGDDDDDGGGGSNAADSQAAAPSRSASCPTARAPSARSSSRRPRASTRR